MAKLAASKKVGIPVPVPLPDDVTHLVVYYGPPGFAPSYSQSARIEIHLANVHRATVDGTQYFVFDTASLLAQTTEAIDLYFTLMDVSDDEEGDFSPVIRVPFDRTPPTTLGTPIIL